MKLIINKFMPISQKCEIDLSKKVTVFVGKNNSGKTYIHYTCIYRLQQFSFCHSSRCRSNTNCNFDKFKFDEI